MLKRYVVFCGDDTHHSAGGWRDVVTEGDSHGKESRVCSFDSVEEAAQVIGGQVDEKAFEWVHIVDLHTGTIECSIFQKKMFTCEHVSDKNVLLFNSSLKHYTDKSGIPVRDRFFNPL